MGFLERSFLLHERDDKEKLLPVEYPVPELGGRKVLFIPTMRGEILKLHADFKIAEAMEDAKLSERLKAEEKGNQIKTDIEYMEEFVSEHLHQPKLSVEDLRNSKLIKVDGKATNIVEILMKSLYAASGINIDTKDPEEELQKKLKGSPKNI